MTCASDTNAQMSGIVASPSQPVPRTADDLMELLRRSRIMADSLYTRLLPQVTPLRRASALELARVLVNRKVLTIWQAQQLLKGQTALYVGRFKILEMLGRGGMGKVYVAEQISMERLVAVKIVRPQLAHIALNRSRFAREARLVAAVSHPNLVQAFDFDEDQGVPYIVMEFVEGLSCEQYLQEFGPMPWRRACDVVMQAARGLSAAHDAGLVHRDVKPPNVLVDSSGHVKVLDLGLAACLDEQNTKLTMHNMYLGTVDYIAPEQAMDSHDVDGRADIYALGAMLYHLVAGRTMFPPASPGKLLMQHQMEKPQPLSEVVPGLPSSFCSVVDRMLRKNPDDRYATAEEVASELESFAQRTVPPYDLSKINFRRSYLRRFLRRSPRTSAISGSVARPIADLGASTTAAPFVETPTEVAPRTKAQREPAVKGPHFPIQKKSRQTTRRKPSRLESTKWKAGIAVVGLLSLLVVAVAGTQLRGHAVAPSSPAPATPITTTILSGSLTTVSSTGSFTFHPVTVAELHKLQTLKAERRALFLNGQRLVEAITEEAAIDVYDMSEAHSPKLLARIDTSPLGGRPLGVIALEEESPTSAFVQISNQNDGRWLALQLDP